MKPRIAPFFRNSSQAQKDDDTIYRQIDVFESLWPELSKTYDLYQRHPGGSPADQYFVDEGFNLESWDKTKAFHELMTLCEQSEVQAIYVSEGDRLFRSRSNALRGRILDILRENNVSVIAKTGEISQNSLTMEITSAIGADSKRAFIRTCHEAKISRITKEGRPPTGRVPFCFHWDKREKKWSLVESEVILFKCAVGLSIGKIFEEMNPQVKCLVQLNPDGMSDKAVAEALSTLGFSKHSFYVRTNMTKRINSCTSRDLNASSVDKMLCKDRYCGSFEVSMLEARAVGNLNKRLSDRKVYTIKVPRVLSDEDWNLLQLKRNRRRKWATRNQKHDYLCKDLLVCKECNIRLAARPKYVERFVKALGEMITYPPTLYYTCARKRKVSGFRCSSNKCHPVATIDDIVWNSFAKMIQSPGSLKSLFASSESRTNRAIRKAELEKVVAMYIAEIKGLESSRKRSNRLLAVGTIEESDFSQQIEEIKARQNYLEKEVISTKMEIRSLSSHPDISSALSAILKMDLSVDLTFDQQRDLLKSVVSRISITNEGEITIVLKGGIEWAV